MANKNTPLESASSFRCRDSSRSNCLLCQIALEFTNGFTSANNLEVFSRKVYCILVHISVLLLQSATKFTFFESIKEVDLLQSMSYRCFSMEIDCLA